ncbi:MAG: cation:proton antiporter, partial [Gemmatimonadaceae bacterium]|nr:cation:proton antiporter [Chitinophagaceae bacterium]
GESFLHAMKHPLAVLLLQIIAIVMVARLFGFLFNKIGQPTVIGEIIAGIVLGPSLVGLFFPDVSSFIFPAASLGNLQFLSQVGLILFMFVIGMELDIGIIRKQAHGAVIISHASIIIPYTLGMGLSYFMFTEFAPKNISFLSFALFMGIAMSITAFPVLARVIQERGLTKTKLGALAITCAAADDITAWCILAVVIAIVKAGSFVSSIFTIALAIGYVFMMLRVVRPFLIRLGNIYTNKEQLSKPVIAIVFMILLMSSYATEIIGIHALFGAFLAGVVMPPELRFRKILIEKIEDVSVVLLLPLFFVFTGLRTQIGLLTTGHLWATCGWVILVAVAGKFGGSAIAARVTGESWKSSLSIGALMNTRGLMELIVLNIGYDLGILSPEVFAMMVIMALVTTFMTGPALDLINWLMPDKEKGEEHSLEKARLSRILLSFGTGLSGRRLLRLAHQMMGRDQISNHLTAINLTYNADINPWQIPEFEKETFRNIRSEARKHQLEIATEYMPVKDLQKAIAKITHEGSYDLLLIDAGKSLLKGTFLGSLLQAGKLLYPPNLVKTLAGSKKLLPQLIPVNDMMDEKAKTFIAEAKGNTGIFIDKDFDEAERIFIPMVSQGDAYLFDYALQFVENNDSQIAWMAADTDVEYIASQSERLKIIHEKYPRHIEKISNRPIDKSILGRYDLMLISYETWESIASTREEWIEHIPSTLIILSSASKTLQSRVQE